MPQHRLTILLAKMINRAAARAGKTQSLRLDGGTMLGLTIDSTGRRHFNITGPNGFPELSEWKTFMKYWPEPLPAPWPRPIKDPDYGLVAVWVKPGAAATLEATPETQPTETQPTLF